MYQDTLLDLQFVDVTGVTSLVLHSIFYATKKNI